MRRKRVSASSPPLIARSTRLGRPTSVGLVRVVRLVAISPHRAVSPWSSGVGPHRLGTQRSSWRSWRARTACAGSAPSTRRLRSAGERYLP